MIVVEHLSIVTLVRVLMSLPRRSARPSVILYLEATRAGRVAARFASMLLQRPIAEADYRLLDVRDEMGQLMFLRVLSQDISEVLRSMTTETRYRTSLAQLGASGRLLPFLLKSLADFDLLTSRRSQQLVPALLIIQIARWLGNQREHSETIELWLSRRPWWQSLERYASGQRVIIRSGPARLLWGSLGLFPFGSDAISFGRWLQFWYQRAVSGQFRTASPTPPVEKRSAAAVGVACRGHANLAHAEQHSELMFVDGRSIQPVDTVVVFERDRSLPPAPVFESLQKYGVRSILVNRHAPCQHALTVMLPPPPMRSRRLGADDGAFSPPERRWIAQQVSKYDRIVKEWRHLIEASHVRLLLTWYKYDAVHVAMSDAVNRCGGALAMYQRAYEGTPSAMTAVFADVMFGWSAWIADLERRSGSNIPHFVITGYLGDHRFAPLKERAARLRSQLQAAGARRIVAYFDENSHDDERWLLGHTITRTAYAALLDKVLQHPWFGLVIKPKHPSSLRRRLGPVRRLLEDAIATGRCHLFDDATGAHVPAEAALSADVAIHGHVHAASAGIEAALAGVPTLLMDLEGAVGYRPYVLGEGRVIFRSWSDAWEACLARWEGKDAHSEIGDWTPFLDEVDPYRDGRAAERMAHYLGSAIARYRQGATINEALADASDSYGRKWGRNRVVSIGPESVAITPDRLKNVYAVPNL